MNGSRTHVFRLCADTTCRYPHRLLLKGRRVTWSWSVCRGPLLAWGYFLIRQIPCPSSPTHTNWLVIYPYIQYIHTWRLPLVSNSCESKWLQGLFFKNNIRTQIFFCRNSIRNVFWSLVKITEVLKKTLEF